MSELHENHLPDDAPSRGWQGAVLRLLQAPEYDLTVTGREELNEHYLRLSFAGGGLLLNHETHPTMWIRMWFPGGGKLHQRGYTIVNPDPDADSFDVEFTLHDGIASHWARGAQPGANISATVLGSHFALPEHAGYVIVGDAASLPAINSILESVGDKPVRVFLAADHNEDKGLPVARHAGVEWIDRSQSTESFVQAVRAAAFDASDHFGWVASNNRTTRAIAEVLRQDYRIPRRSIKAQAYWAEGL